MVYKYGSWSSFCITMPAIAFGKRRNITEYTYNGRGPKRTICNAMLDINVRGYNRMSAWVRKNGL